MGLTSPLQPWLVADLDTATNKKYNRKRYNLFEAAENSKWDQVFSILQDAQKTYHQSWVNCPTNEEGWTPLHYAALENTPVATVNRLVRLGAWRSIKTVTTNGTNLPRARMTPIEIAEATKHTALYEALKPVTNLAVSDSALRKLESLFHQLICKDMGWRKGEVRLPELSVLKESSGDGWFPVRPGVNSEVGPQDRCDFTDGGFEKWLSCVTWVLTQIVAVLSVSASQRPVARLELRW
jgi:hypothetical protein